MTPDPTKRIVTKEMLEHGFIVRWPSGNVKRYDFVVIRELPGERYEVHEPLVDQEIVAMSRPENRPDPISRISQLESENERLRAEWAYDKNLVEIYRKHNELMRSDHTQSCAEITRLKGQRDRLLSASKKVIETTGGLHVVASVDYEFRQAIAEIEAKP